jgi:hypothetical protein
MSVLELAKALAKLADTHHRTLEASRLHNPQENMNFWECPCLTCKHVTEILRENGYDPESFIEYTKDENSI